MAAMERGGVSTAAADCQRRIELVGVAPRDTHRSESRAELAASRVLAESSCVVVRVGDAHRGRSVGGEAGE